MVVCPGVFDGLTARLALAAGFDALYMVCPVLAGAMLLMDHVSSDRRRDINFKAWLGRLGHCHFQ